ncbi:hypothetical protein [Streptomyces sp. NPDC051211]|uniref:hypothetical protein n=1 Tax=Streptomyces sp. NPDC051211 TaxID=3154643 RepID=UPI00344C4D44
MTESTPTPEDHLVIIEPTPVAEDDKATLHLEEQDGQFTLKAVGGSGIPVRIPVLDEQGNVIAVYNPVVPTVEGKMAIIDVSGEDGGRNQTDILNEASQFTSVRDFGGLTETPHYFTH